MHSGWLLNFSWFCCGLLVAISPARGDLIIFNLGGSLNGTPLDGASSGALTVAGLTATLTANDGLLNATSANFGINAAGPNDAADLLDAGSGVHEFITIAFDQTVAVTQLSLTAFSGNERAQLTLGHNAPWILPATAAGIDVYNFSPSDFPLGNILAPGQTMSIGYTLGSAEDNGFSLHAFQVQSIPEPTSAGYLLTLLLGCRQRRKRRS